MQASSLPVTYMSVPHKSRAGCYTLLTILVSPDFFSKGLLDSHRKTSASNVFAQNLSAAKLGYFLLKLFMRMEKFCVVLKFFCPVLVSG